MLFYFVIIKTKLGIRKRDSNTIYQQNKSMNNLSSTQQKRLIRP
jgi:hypothetical protein